MNRKIFYVLLLFTFIPYLIFASNGRIKGKVTDLSTGEALVGANVLVVGTSYGAATDVNGDFIIMNLNAGTYSVKATYLGYQGITTTNIRVNTDLTTEVDFQLPAEEISVGTVTIVAQKPLIKKDATSSIRSVTGDDIQNLPVRGVTNIVALQAGVVVDSDGDIHIRGSRPTEVGYYLEGTSVSDPYLGGRAVALSNDAIEELQVESGGFTAQYGGSSAGIIRAQLKSGTSDYHFSIEHITDNIAFQSKDDFFDQDKRLGAYWYGNDESSFSFSGPVPGLENKIKFFYNLNYNFDRSRDKKAYPGFDYGLIGPTTDQVNTFNNDTINAFYPKGVRTKNKRVSLTHSGSLTMDFNPITVRLSGTYNSGESDFNWLNNFDNILTMTNDRTMINDFSDGTINGRLTHVLSPKLFYEISGGYSFSDNERSDKYLGDDIFAYGDSVANANAGYTFIRSERDIRTRFANLTPEQTRYQPPGFLNIFGMSFTQNGRVESNYRKWSRETFQGRVDLSYIPNKNHNIKFGGEFKQHRLRDWTSRSQVSYAAALDQAMRGDNPGTIEEEKKKILYANGVDNYGYDVLGNKTDEDGFYEPKQPIEAGIYLQDKIEFDDIILNVGLRYDYFDMDHLKFKDPARPELGVTDVSTSGTLLEEGYEEVAAFSSLSPRLSVSFPVTDKTVFHAGYGKYVQQPSLDQAYDGYHRIAWEMSTSFHFAMPTGANLRPIRKTHYEVGFRQELTDFLAVDVSGYYDDIKGQITFIQLETDAVSPYTDYFTKQNGDFSTTKGIEVQLTMRRYNRLSGTASLSFEDARGTGASPDANGGIIGAPIDGVSFTPNYVSPLTYSRPFQGNFFIDYRFGVDDGPAFFDQMGFSLLGTFKSGHPYTRGVGSGEDLENRERFRLAIEPANASFTPSNFNVDLKIDKTFNIWDQLSANVYVKVLNLFDTRNVEEVYVRTGTAEDDGYIYDPNDGELRSQQFGPNFTNLYKSVIIDYNGFYGDARQILLGVRLEY